MLVLPIKPFYFYGDEVCPFNGIADFSGSFDNGG
jgi:hypothetical protein